MKERTAVPEAMTPFLSPTDAALRRSGPRSARYLLLGVCAAFLLLLGWAAFAEIEELVRGGGQIIPSQRIQHIQNLEGGILREILVREGELVDKGALLLRIDNEQAGSAYRDALSRGYELEASIARSRARISGGEPEYPEDLVKNAPDVIVRHNQLLEGKRRQDAGERRTLEAQIEHRKLEEQEQFAKKRSLEEALGLARRRRDVAKRLVASRSYSEMEYLGLAQQVSALEGELETLAATIPKTGAAVREAEERLVWSKSQADAASLEDITRANAELAALREILVAGADRVTRTEARSPVRGLVKSIKITTAGGVIMPGEIIMDIVPVDDTLIVEARVSPQDIAFLFVDQKAKIRLTAYDFAVYGTLDARVEQIGADTIEGKNGEVFYLVKLRTSTATLSHNGKELPLLPGMMATVDIITGKKTVLDYILKPIIRAQQTALRER